MAIFIYWGGFNYTGMYKKSQITLFLIVGIILVLAVLSYFFIFSSNNDDSNQNLNTISNQRYDDMIRSFVEEEAREILIEGIYLIGLRGGYIYSFEEKLITEGGPFAYHIKNEEIISPDRLFIQSELERFLSENLDFQLFFLEFEEVDVEFSDVISEITITENYVLAELNIKTTVDSQSSTEFFNYNLRVPYRLGFMLEKRDEIVQNFKENPTMISNFAYDDITLNIISFNRQNYIFSILDNQSQYEGISLVYNIALEHISYLPPRLDFISNFVTSVNVPFSYQLNAISFESDYLEYSVNNSLVNLDNQNGNFTFVSDEEGEFYFKFCVHDSYNEDCQEVRIIVEE